MKNSLSPTMILTLFLALAFVCSGVISQPVIAQKRGLDTPVTSKIQDFDLITSLGYRIESDTLGPYYNAVDSVASVLQACCGDWVLATSPNSTAPSRTVLVDFRDPVPNSGASPPFAYQYIFPRIIAKAHETTPGSIAGMKGLNSTILSPLSVAFSYNGDSYGLRMNPVNWPQTNYARVTCTGVVDPTNPSTSQCNQWTIKPSVTQPDGELKSIAHLERLPKFNVSESHGDFYMSFSMLITNP